MRPRRSERKHAFLASSACLVRSVQYQCAPWCALVSNSRSLPATRCDYTMARWTGLRFSEVSLGELGSYEAFLGF